MNYQIDASLFRGAPTLRLLDPRSGEERLFWRQPVADENEIQLAWRDLFKQLVLLSSHHQNTANNSRKLYPVNSTRRKQRTDAAFLPDRKNNRQKQCNVIYLPLRKRKFAQ